MLGVSYVTSRELLALTTIAVCLFGCGAASRGTPQAAKSESAGSTGVTTPAASAERVPPEKKTNPSSGKCPAFKDVPLLDSRWFSVLDDVRQLNDKIRYFDAPDATVLIPETNAREGSFRAREAEWRHVQVAGKIVAARRVVRPPGSDPYLKTNILGDFVVGVLGARDYSCPIAAAGGCYELNTEQGDPEPRPRFCRSDVSVECKPNGDLVTIEVLDVPGKRLRRLEDLRRVHDVSSSLHQGRVRLVVDDCVWDAVW